MVSLCLFKQCRLTDAGKWEFAFGCDNDKKGTLQIGSSVR